MKTISTLMSVIAITVFLTPTLVNAITRNEMMTTAESYLNHSWTPTDINKMNSATGEKWTDSNGVEHDIWVKTPDDRFSTDGGWWTINAVQVGVPYMWGGYDTLTRFDAGISNGKAAGDMETSEPWGSSKAVGVDCSGFVSRVWGFPDNVKYGTSQLPNHSKHLTKKDASGKIVSDYDKLEEGDILLNEGRHVMLYISTSTVGGIEIYTVYEAVSGDWKVAQNKYKKADIVSKYKPYTYFQTSDIMLTIDRSGSMSGIPIAEAKKASKLFVDLMKTDDQIGVVSFSSGASVNYPLTEINDTGTIKTAAKSAIEALSAGGGTSVDSGLIASNNQIVASGKKSASKAIILLTDGQSAHNPAILADITNNDTKVFTIGLGWPNESLLRNIAAKTGGSYYFAPSSDGLQSIYDSISAAVSGESDVMRTEQIITQGATQILRAFIDSSMPSIIFSILWGGSDLDLELIQPDGTIINPTVASNNPNIEYISGDTHEIYKVNAPMAGEWQMRITAVVANPGGEKYTASVKGKSGVGFSVDFDKDEYLITDPVHITTKLNHSLVDTPVRGALDASTPDIPNQGAIIGANAIAIVTDPSGGTHNLALLDDGNHNDKGANDGVYGTSFSSTSVKGSYKVRIDVEGKLNNVDKEPFTRSVTESIVVGGDSDGDGMPDAWENVNGLNSNSDDAGGDLDNDQLKNKEEYENKTDPQNPDSDNDGFSDGEEVSKGSDPNDEYDTPISDDVPPITSINLLGDVWQDIIYTSDVEVVLVAQDDVNGTGVAKTEYSFNGGLTWVTYLAPFSVITLSTHTILYRSYDNAGNIEEVKEKTFEIVKAQSLKKGVIQSLNDAKTGGRKTDEKIDNVIRQISDSLKINLWKDEVHVNFPKGTQVFVKEMAAITLMDGMLDHDNKAGERKKNTVPDSVRQVFEMTISDLLYADKTLAEVSIKEATTTDAQDMKATIKKEKLLAKAKEAMQKAEEVADEKSAKAVFWYGRAWFFSQLAARVSDKRFDAIELPESISENGEKEQLD